MTDRRAKKAKRQETRRESQEHASREMNRDALNLAKQPDIDWYVVFVMSGKEFPAHKILHRHAEGVYLPLHRRWRGVNRYVRDKRCKSFPAIPGSLFLGFRRGAECWFNILKGQGVARGVLGIAGCPLAISGRRLREFILGNEEQFEVPDEQQFMRSHCEFTVGDTVQIVEGPFEGMIVDVRSIRGRNASVLLDVLGGAHNLEVALDKLARVA